MAPSNQTGTVTLGQNIEVSFYYRETRLLVHYVLEEDEICGNIELRHVNEPEFEELI